MSYFYFACKTSSRVVCVGLLTVQLFFNPSQKSLWKRKRRKSSSKDIKLFTYNNTMADAAAPAPELKEYPEFPGQKLSKRYALLSSLFCCCCCRRYSNETKISSWFFPSSSLFFLSACVRIVERLTRARSLSISFPHLSLSLSLSPKQNSQRV